jgi:hypothetical protein
MPILSVGNSATITLGYVDTSSTYTAGYAPNLFDGTPENVSEYGMVHVTCHADASGVIKTMHSIDTCVWDFTESTLYQDTSVSIGVHIRKDLKAKWYKTQFLHEDTTVGNECNLRIQTMFHPAQAL